MFTAILISAMGTHRHIPDLKAPPPKRAFALSRVIGDMVVTLSHRSLLMLLGAGLFAESGDRGVASALTHYFLTFFWELSNAQIVALLVSNLISAIFIRDAHRHPGLAPARQEARRGHAVVGGRAAGTPALCAAPARLVSGQSRPGPAAGSVR